MISKLGYIYEYPDSWSLEDIKDLGKKIHKHNNDPVDPDPVYYTDVCVLGYLTDKLREELDLENGNKKESNQKEDS